MPRMRAAVVAESTKWELGGTLPDPAATSITFEYGTRPLTPLMGDWDGDGRKTVGYFYQGVLYLNDQNDNSVPEHTIRFGDPRGYSVAGDFDGNRIDDVAIYRSGRWEILYLGSGGAVLRTDFFTLGAPFGTGYWPNTIPVAGDWNGDGIDGIGTYDLTRGWWVLKNVANGVGGANHAFTFWNGTTSTYPVVGDWNGDSIDTPGYRVGSTWIYRNTVDHFSPTASFVFGAPNSIPFTW